MKHSKTAAIVIGALAAALVISLGGCAVNGGGKEYRDPSVPIVVEKGEEFTIALESNPTTGYRWMLQKELDDKVITLQKTEFEEPESNLLGAPGEERWTFKAVGLGRTTIELRYARPWETGDSSSGEVTTPGEGSAPSARGTGEEGKGEVTDKASPKLALTKEAGEEVEQEEVGEAEAGAQGETLVFSVWVKKKGATDKEPKKYDNPDEAIEIEEGLEFAIVLESNPTTGYQWQLAEPLDGKILSLVSATFESKGGGEGEEKVGAPGEEVWTFEAVGPGKAEITLAYARPWEKEAAPEETKTFKVEVKAVEEAAGD